MKNAGCRKAKTAVWVTSLLLLLAGCAQDAESIMGKSPLGATVAQELGGYRFHNTNSQRNVQGYAIESGNLAEPLKGRIDGSLVVVTDKDGAITAIIDRPGRRGALFVDKTGSRRFVEEPAYDYLKADTLKERAGPAQVPGADKPDNDGQIDALMLFSTKALAVLNADPVAFALAQLETSNLGLRNSQVGGVSLRLAGVRVTETDLPVDGTGLVKVRDMLTPLRPVYKHDINVGYFDNSPYGGMAYVPGSASVNSIHHPLAFRHEVGHNVGGNHCNETGADNYRFGYQTSGGAHTMLCGNNIPYYSNPQVTYGGRPLGNARTADMARLWREEAGRMSGYSPAFEGTRLIYVSTQPESSAIVAFIPGRSRIGVVALSSEVGPTSLTYGGPGVTTLTAKLTGKDGVARSVNLRAMRQNSGCPRTTMNSTLVCHPDFDGGPVQLIIGYSALDNPELPPGWYNGTVTLEARNDSDPNWRAPILVSLAVLR
ncbi:TPA: hypothetical protein U8251_003053 [Pseudomonas putida]|nr:hypothetical protein [Pseudomonas putida]